MGRLKIQNSPSIRRIPSYLHKLMLMKSEGITRTSTTVLADYMNLEPIVVRKDLALTGITGKPGVGYDTEELIKSIRHFLSWDTVCNACLVGAGALGTALIGQKEFEEYGMQITSVFDNNPDKIGATIREHEVFDVARMSEIIRLTRPDIGIICVPPDVAQNVVDEMVKDGIQAFWNFANVVLRVPPHVIVQREIIAGGFALLSAKLVQKGLKNPSVPGNKKMVKIVICMGSSCFEKGNKENLRLIENFIQKHSLEGQVDLSGKCCLSECSDGPNVIINDVCYHHPARETLLGLLCETFHIES